jgi:hypothetical protein
VKPLEKSKLQATATGQAKSTSYFIELRSNPELNLMMPMKANRLMVIAKTVRSIVKYKF